MYLLFVNPHFALIFFGEHCNPLFLQFFLRPSDMRSRTRLCIPERMNDIMSHGGERETTPT